MNVWNTPENARIWAREAEYTAWQAEQDAADRASEYAEILSPRFIREFPNS